ncbi:MAG TPA: DUF1109 domain-containing protein [Caldimonas sp.]|nr:DUF1109 domain-containing protein [Caldimonas sp.]
MKTEALIAMLARGDPGVAPGATDRRLGATVAGGVALALVAVLATLGLRPDITAAAHLPLFWGKLFVPLAVATLSFLMARRLASPGQRAGRAAALAAGLLALLWAVAALDVAAAPAGSRAHMILGRSAVACMALIAMLSMPILAALFVALRSLAPTRLPAAGAVAGALAGGIAAAAYALHCDEMTLPFLAVWYVLGMAIPAGVGALLAPRWLRWS